MAMNEWMNENQETAEIKLSVDFNTIRNPSASGDPIIVSMFVYVLQNKVLIDSTYLNTNPESYKILSG